MFTTKESHSNIIKYSRRVGLNREVQYFCYQNSLVLYSDVLNFEL